jgi:hypothetical protein
MFGDKIAHSFYQREDDTFTFFNPGITTITIGILSSNWVKKAFPTLKGIDPSIIPDPEQFSDYQELINDKEMTPKMIKGIRLIVSDQKSLVNAMFWVSQDANGEKSSFADYPFNLLSPMQYQERLVDLYYDNLIVGLNQFMAYELQPLESATMTFVYDDFRLENLLGKGHQLRKVLYSKKDLELMEKLL